MVFLILPGSVSTIGGGAEGSGKGFSGQAWQGGGVGAGVTLIRTGVVLRYLDQHPLLVV